MMTTAAEKTKRRETLEGLKDAIEEIDAELIGAVEELREVRERIAGLKADRKWRLEAHRYVRAGGK
jgi:chorismate mutase